MAGSSERDELALSTELGGHQSKRTRAAKRSHPRITGGVLENSMGVAVMCSHRFFLVSNRHLKKPNQQSDYITSLRGRQLLRKNGTLAVFMMSGGATWLADLILFFRELAEEEEEIERKDLRSYIVRGLGKVWAARSQR